MSNKNGSKWIRPEKRLAIYDRDGFACVYCGCGADESEHALTLDHVVARELGGSHEADNLLTACFTCNSAKRDETNRWFFAWLRDRGVDTSRLSTRVRRQLGKKIDLQRGHELYKMRRAGGMS